MQLHTVAHVLMIQWKYLLSVEKNGERTKCILFFSSKRTSFQDDLLWLWIPPCPPPPHPALSGGKSTDFLCLNGLAKDTFYMREKEKKIHFIFFLSFVVLDLHNHFKMAPVLLCFVHERWFESYVGLNEKRWVLVCQSVFGQKPETLQPLQCSCGLQA